MLHPIYYSLTVLFVFVSSMLVAQVSDDFSDGDYTNAPAWLGETANFEVDGVNQLHLIAPGITDTSYLSVISTSINNASWEFYVELDFGTSGSNLARVYLASSNSDLKGTLNGYFVMVGNSDDEVSLYRQDGTTKTKIIDGTDGLVGSDPVTVRVKVTRDAAGNWELLADNTGGSSYVSQGTVLDDTHISSAYAGVHCKYTSTRSTLFYFDDFVITGTAFVDNVAPTVNSTVAISNSEVDVTYSESVDQAIAETLTNYTADGGLGNPISVTLDGSNPSLVHLTFATTFTNGQTYNLTIENIEDLASNVIVTASSTFLFFTPDTPLAKDVVINEFLCDPTPSVGLLEEEFIELHNVTTSKYFELNGWKISDGSSNGTIGSYVLAPGEFVILCSAANQPNFDFLYGNAVAVTSFPSLNNGGETITLSDNASTLLDEVTYDLSFYGDEDKEDGGWSLELVNPELPCESAVNWKASNGIDGGTPGTINSVYNNTPDTDPPSPAGVIVMDNMTLLVSFSESVSTAGTYVITPSILISGSTISATNSANVVVNLVTAIDTGIVYTLNISATEDCSGNALGTSVQTFVLPNSAKKGDLIINELLSNPLTGGDDFVEIYNNSNKFINIYGFQLATLDDGAIGGEKFIGQNFVIDPGAYLVITEDSSNVKRDYFGAVPGRFVQTDIPTYSNSEGSVYLLMPNDTVSDYFDYYDDLHFVLLNDVKGVSLERIDFNQATNVASNWHSAAKSVGYATPGYENSQYFPGTITDEMVNIIPEIFSPDNDGFEDVLSIGYNLNEPGFVGNVTIFDAAGRLVKNLVQNELLGNSGTIVWDGVTNSLEKVRIGAYILHFEVFNTAGEISAVKKAFAVGGKF